MTILESMGPLSAECIRKQREPIKVSGTVCGSVFAAGNYDSLPGVELVVRNAAGVVIARVTADANARFQFQSIPKGRYRVEAPGWTIALAVGIPLGICAKALTTGNRWSRFDDQWASVFQIGFVFQLVSLVLAARILLLYAMDGLEDYKKVPMFALLLAGDVVIGGIALPSWRSPQERLGRPVPGDDPTKSQTGIE